MSVSRDFVERPTEGFYIAGTRIPLACIVRPFPNGQSPEVIRSSFPTLTLEQVYGAITFYLGNMDDVHRDIADREAAEDAFSDTHPAPSELRAKLGRFHSDGATLIRADRER